ncbi:MAG: penicillin-binding transpeptidase domain-containing protein [Caulobacterales bacterium]|uniref:penicillin-binding transpeptidase domain-containing protein n=1 Tax=Glycocaulis sp. TaxID=1969725 RepID=UPI003F9F5BE6
MKGILAGLALLLVLMSPSHAQVLDRLLDEAGVTGTILIQRVSDGAEWTGGAERLDERFIPASTFKIPNSLILLQSGTVSGGDERLEWDGTEHSFASWNQDQTFTQAFQRSAVWAYQEWSRRLGHSAMSRHVAALGYGNGDIGEAASVDRFWLEGPLQISAREQIDFLARLQARDLPLDGAHMETVIAMMEQASGADWTLRGKTGWRFGGDPDIGWYVGWLEHQGEVWLFALNIDMPDPENQIRLRASIVEAALSQASRWTR